MVERRLGQGVVQQRTQTAGNFLFLAARRLADLPGTRRHSTPRGIIPAHGLEIRPRRPLARATAGPGRADAAGRPEIAQHAGMSP